MKRTTEMSHVQISLEILVLFLLAWIFYVTYPIITAIHRSKEIEAHTIPYEQHFATSSMKILVAGDSTGVGTGAEDNQQSTAGRIGKDFPHADIKNISENGLKLEGLRNKLESLPDEQYDLIVIQIGANDIVGRTSYKEIESQLNDVLDISGGFSKKIVVLTSGNIGLSPVFKFPVSTFMMHRTRAVRDIFLDQIGDRAGIDYVDLFKNKEEDPFGKNVEHYYATDFFHPNGEGYGVWYEQMRPFLLD